MTNTDTRCLTCGHEKRYHDDGVPGVAVPCCYIEQATCPEPLHPFVPAPSTAEKVLANPHSSEKARTIAARVLARQQDAPSTTYDPATATFAENKLRLDAILAETNRQVPSTTDAVEAARIELRAMAGYPWRTETGRLQPIMDAQRRAWEAAEDAFEAALLAREGLLVTALQDEIREWVALSEQVKVRYARDASRIEALEAVVDEARQWIPAGTQADFLLAALDKPVQP